MLAAVQQDEGALQHASEELRSKIQDCAAQLGCTTTEAARGLASPLSIQVSLASVGDDSAAAVSINYSNLAGETPGTIAVKAGSDGKELRCQLARELGVPGSVLQIILPSGTRLRDEGLTKSVRELFLQDP